MSVRDAVAVRDEQTANTPARVSPAEVVAKAIEVQSRAFHDVLPKSVDPDRFARLVLTAIKAAPQLMECFETQQGGTSVLLAAMQAATLGLEPNTPTQDCWLLPRRMKGTMECQLSIGYRGLMRLARRSGVIETVFAEVVHDRDEFTWERGLEADVLSHKPYDGPDEPGELTHTYAVARFKGGGYSFIVVPRRDVEARRAMSDSWKNTNSRPYSPWTKWPEAMWRKTAIRALMPYLDLSPEASSAFQVDEARVVLDTTGQLASVPDDTPALMSVPEPPDEPETVTVSDRDYEGAGTHEEPLDGPTTEIVDGIEVVSATGEVTDREATDLTDKTRRHLFAEMGEVMAVDGTDRDAWLAEANKIGSALNLPELTGSRADITEAQALELIAGLDRLRGAEKLIQRANGKWAFQRKTRAEINEEPF